MAKRWHGACFFLRGAFIEVMLEMEGVREGPGSERVGLAWPLVYANLFNFKRLSPLLLSESPKVEDEERGFDGEFKDGTAAGSESFVSTEVFCGMIGGVVKAGLPREESSGISNLHS